MRAGSVFSGIGGFDAALERVGIEIAWQDEFYGYARGDVLELVAEVERLRAILEAAGVAAKTMGEESTGLDGILSLTPGVGGVITFRGGWAGSSTWSKRGRENRHV